MSTATGKLIPVFALVGAAAFATGGYFVGRAGSTSQPAAVMPEAGEKSATDTGKIALAGEAAKTAGIKTVPARYAAFGESLVVPGTVEVSPNRGAKVTPPVAGKIIALFAEPGDAVQAGRRLAVLDSPDVALAHAAVRESEARIAEARAGVQTAQAGVEQAQTKQGSAQAALQRQRDLVKTGALSQPSLQAAQNEMNAAQSGLMQARTDLQAQGVVVGRNQRLFDAQIVAKAELEQSQVGQTQAQTRVDEAEKRVALAQKALEREQKVYRGGLLNRQAVQSAEADVRAAEGDVRQARRQEQAARTILEGAITGLAAARANLRAVEGDGHAEGGAGRIAVFAPISGTVATRSASIGQAVERGSDLFTVHDLESVLVTASVPEASASRAHVGAPVAVTVAAYPDARFTGVVESIGSAVDEKTRALPVRCRVLNRGGALKPGMFARVNLAAGAKREALVVPDAAVDEDGDKRFVYVRTSTDGYEKREIKIRQTSGGLVEVAEGVKAGDAVATDGLFVLKSESKRDELKGDED